MSNLLKKLLADDLDAKVDYHPIVRAGAYTIASVTVTYRGVNYDAQGISKCSNSDKQDNVRGEEIAFGRARQAGLTKACYGNRKLKFNSPYKA